jgi:hypothetical protein
MSSTTGIQNLLVNVIRPVYAYDATATLYTPKIEFTNVDTYSGNVVTVLRADISDANSNVYVGTASGNTPATLTRGCFYTVAVGVSAGNSISNVSNSVYLGYNAGNGAIGASNVIAIGANSIGGGTSNIVLGAGSGGTGSSNIVIGHGITTGTSSQVLQVGNAIYGDLSTNWVGIGTPSPINDFSNRFDVSGNTHIYGNLAVNVAPGDRTLDVNGNFRASDAYGTLDFSNGILTTTGMVRSVNPGGDFQTTNALAFIDSGLNTLGRVATENSNTYIQAVSNVKFGQLTQSTTNTTLKISAPGAGLDLLTTDGYTSAQNTTTVSGGVTTIGTLKKGIVLVSAVDNASSANRAARVLFAYTTSNASDLASNLAAGNASITLSTSNIQITDATNATYTWSITYLPLP